MEEIISFRDGTSAYVDDHDVISTTKKKSQTPMYAVICINGKFYQCMPTYENSCGQCAFFNEKNWSCSCCDFPCIANERADNQNCVFVEIYEEDSNESITTQLLKTKIQYRFKL